MISGTKSVKSKRRRDEEELNNSKADMGLSVDRMKRTNSRLRASRMRMNGQKADQIDDDYDDGRLINLNNMLILI